MSSRIVVNPRVDSQVPLNLLDRLRALPTALIGHALDEEFMEPGIRPACSPVRFCGPAVTVRSYGRDSAIVHMAIEAAQPGDVIIVDRAGDQRYACWGGGVAFAAQQRGIAGAVIDGMTTDRLEIEELGFQVFGRGISPVTTRILGESGELNIPVACGGVTVGPGDIILADDDGILVLPPERVEEVVETYEQRVPRGEIRRKDVLAGKSLPDLSGARERILANMTDSAGSTVP